jgi:DNA-binding MarR family transcriptional regulator
VNPSISAIALRTLAVDVVRAGSILQREAGRLFRGAEISAAQFNVINLVAGHPKGLKAAEIAHSLVVDPSSTTYLLDQLEERGWARRERDPDDRRALRIVLTPAGKALHKKLVVVYHDALQRMSELLEANEIAAALPFLEKLPAAAVEAVDATLADATLTPLARSAARRTGKRRKT